MSAVFHDHLLAIIPKLRVQAIALTRNRTDAEDLVQNAVCNALAAKDSFIPGTNFAAWMHRIVRNRFISDLRARRPTCGIEDVNEAAYAVRAPQEDLSCLGELSEAVARLPAAHQHALVMVVVHGMSYEQLAEETNCAVGTAKSRVFRARQQLETWLMGHSKKSAAPSIQLPKRLVRRANPDEVEARLN